MIRVTDLRKFRQQRDPERDHFRDAAANVLGVIGASGSGKSTLLRCLNGLETIDGGTVECNGVRLEAGLSHAEYRRREKNCD